MTKAIKLPSAEYLRSRLDYDPDTGVFRWKNCSPRFDGRIAGTQHKLRGTQGGYVYTQLDNRLYRAHRLAWVYMTGEEPEDLVDHINGIRHDNRWSNLRRATPSQNLMNKIVQSNNTSGAKGVIFDKERGLWKAEAYIDGSKIHLGRYKAYEEAAKVATGTRKELHKEFFKL